ncbi:hypothetical protein [Magnetospirillum aberrantis]|uniref:Tryptophan synthase subunit beta like protein n=1 Tax=Magnetospirillum aberrantis SpK TaxID=908842 RepID=A0A7C9QV83_9PROT|nr:hypothetical protein [Magnetospirillum aberrantis]NFV81440.1 hypothetical protein [Magnetospirillum aberrantis SpK]
MPYVVRDQDGQVVAVAEVPLSEDAEEVPIDHPEVLALLSRACAADLADGDEAFVNSDLSFIRVLEDLIEVLIRRGVIALSDLPGPAQDKLMQRRALRGWLAGVVGVVDDDSGKVI